MQGATDAGRDARAVLGADGDEAEVRRGEDARFLRYELDRYLLGRGTEQKKELPLSRVENQPYIHYRKGSLVMYALADYIGEDNVNRAHPRVSAKKGVQGPAVLDDADLLARFAP